MAVKEFTGELDQPAVKDFHGELDAPTEDVGIAEKVAGHPVTRFALGAASPFLGAAQLGLNAVGQGEDINKKLAQLNQAKETGRQWWLEHPWFQTESSKKLPAPKKGADLAELAGAVASPVSLAAMKIPAAAKTAGKIAQGAGIGAGFGATTPSFDKDYWKDKLKQTSLGAAVGGAVPAVMEGGRWLGNKIGEAADLVTKEGPGHILHRYLNKITGEANIPAVQYQLNKAKELVPLSQPTAAEALVGLQKGSPIQAHQEVISKVPGGPSEKFGNITNVKQIARELAQEETDRITTPIRESALAAANAKGGVSTPTILAGIYDLSQRPGLKGSDVVQKTLGDVRRKIGELASTNLRMDANDLYTIRKELGTYIDKNAKDTANFDKKVASGLLRDVQKIIDDAIEQSGGKGWKKYLSTYARQAQLIEKDVAREESMYKPLQRTALGGEALKKEELAELPHLLSRPIVWLNYVLGAMGKDVQPKIQRLAADLYANPKALSKFLDNRPSKIDPEVWNAIARTLQIGGATDVATHAKHANQTLGVTP